MLRWMALGTVGLAVIAAVAISVWPSAPSRVRIAYGDRTLVEQGRAVYVAACASCHGAALEGQANWRERGASGRLPAPPHNESGHTWHHADQQLFEITKYGVERYAPPGYASDMPAFEAILSDAQILASLAYIKSTWPPRIQRRHDALNGDKG